jgi:gliding motility-associated-like protein
VTDANGCVDTTSRTVLITNPIPNFGFGYSYYCPGEPLTFSDSSKGYNLTESWNFGDGSGAQLTPTHSFANSGQTYNVTLTVTDQNLCTNSITKPVLIQSPIAAFNIYDSTGVCTPLETTFAAHAQYYDSLYWEFGDTTSSTLDSTSHFYNNFGIDSAKLFVQGPGGCLDSALRRVLIINPVTATSISLSPLRACDSVPAGFQLVPPAYTDFTLIFGDYTANDSSQDLTPFHMYRGPGSYTPQLQIEDETGCIVVIPSPETVTVLGSTPFFTANKHAFCDSATVVLTDYTITNDGFASETYNFGNGTDTTETPGTGNFDFTHDFDQPGLWKVSLQVSTKDACTETYTDTIHVYETPHPVITFPNITCTGLIQLQGSTTLPNPDSLSWLWNFGNNQTSPQQDPTIQMDPGTYQIMLTASVPFGCNDSTVSTVTINPDPEIKGPAEITAPVNIPVTIPFTYSPNVVTWLWSPTTNLSCSNCANPVATLINTTTYTVSVTDANGCPASDTIVIKTICNDKDYWFPNTFSPNGDGVNDWFYPRGSGLYNIQSLTIFNRYGQMVFQRRDFPANAQNMGWDGTYGGKPAPIDTYVYVAEVICENSQVVTLGGNVTLIR